MYKRKIIKGSQTLTSSTIKVDFFADKINDGIIYTLYSDELNSLKVGFAENNRILENKLSSDALILLDVKKGNKEELIMVIKILKELGVNFSKDFYFKYSSPLMRNLSTLGWPVGSSLLKQRKIKKVLQCA